MRQTHWFRAGAAMVLILLMVRGLSARIINVGTDPASPFTTIQAAIDAASAQPGPDRIQIAAGQYLENLAISDADGLTLSGSGGVEIVADSLADAIRIASGDITISDLAIQAGDRGIAAGTVDSPVAALTLRDLVVTNNVKEGLNAVNVADVTVSGCTFRNNGGPAIKVQFAEDLTVSRCTLESNIGRGMRIDDVARVAVSHCQVLGNDDDGIKMVTKVLPPAETSLSISDTTVTGSGDDGIDLEALGDIRLTNVTVANTRGDDGVSIDDSVSVSVIGGTYAGNGARGLNIVMSGTAKLNAITSAGNGLDDVLP